MSATELVSAYVDAWNGENTAVLDDVLAPGFVRHVPAESGPARGADGLREVIAAARLDVPDLRIVVDAVLPGEDQIVFRWVSEGIDSGPGDFPPTNRRFSMPGITWLRLEGGRIAEEWTASDQLDVLLQLGFRVTPPEAD